MNANGKPAVWLLAAALVIIGLASDEARADPSEGCRNLALWFGSNPSALDTGSLAALSTCVTEEIQARAASPGPAVSPTPQSNNDPTSEGQSAPGTQGTWATWPTSPAWKDQAGESKPWDSYDK